MPERIGAIGESKDSRAILRMRLAHTRYVRVL